ncbi:MAG TPA: endonuclease/exonuclease/phosphatase family protein [Myxococcota bacterium]|nr:endonuclease/exonuclease/phosphatase family protein [Myxococcota bacterium]
MSPGRLRGISELARNRRERKLARTEERDAERATRDRRASRREALEAALPYLAIVRAPTIPVAKLLQRDLTVATYNVHRWQGLDGVRAPDPARAGFVISELGADVIALQEVLRPFDEDDPVEQLAEALQLHLAFVTTRVHRRGEIGNAILSRWPITSVFSLDLSFSRVERRSAVAVQFSGPDCSLAVVATHLALVDRTRRRQVTSILQHPQLQGAVLLAGDLNAWRRCEATRTLERELVGKEPVAWPRSFPAARPVLALDRIYARGAEILDVTVHDSAAARRASDHLPVVARVRIL